MSPWFRQIILVCCGIVPWVMLGAPLGQVRLFSVESSPPSPLPTPLADQTYPPPSTNPLQSLLNAPVDPDWRTNWILRVSEDHSTLVTKVIDNTLSDALYFSTDGRWLEQRVRNAIIATAWDWTTIQVSESVALTFSGKSGRRIILSDTSGYGTFMQSHRLPFHPSASWHPTKDHSALTVSDEHESWQVWIMKQSTGQQVADIALSNRPRELAYSPDGEWLAIAADNVVTLYDTNTYHQTAIYPHKRSEVVQIQFSADSKWLLTADADLVLTLDHGVPKGNYHLWDVADEVHYAELLDEPAFIGQDVIFSPDGTMILLRPQGSLRKIATQTTILSYKLSPDRPFFYAFSPDGNLFAHTDASCNCVSVWGTNMGKQIAQLKPNMTINGMVFSPDNQTLAIGGTYPSNRKASFPPNKLSHATELWNILNDQKLHELDYSTDPLDGTHDWLDAQIFQIEWSPWGKWLFTVSGEGKIWIWDPMTGRQMLMLDYFEDVEDPRSISSLKAQFAPQGSAIIARGDGQPIKIYYSK